MTKNKKDKRDKTNRSIIWIVAIAIVVIGTLLLGGIFNIFNRDSQKGRSFMITEKETRPVLDPSMFTGRIRAAYTAARKYRDVINEVFCYCYCDQPPFNHKTLLSCFTEKHGAG